MRAIALLVAMAGIGILAAFPPAAQEVDIVGLFAIAAQDGRVGVARKTKHVDARAAKPGEVIVTVIAGEGVETRSKPAVEGDMVVRNRCPETGNEVYLVAKDRFPSRYSEAISAADGEGWRGHQPKSGDMRFFVLKAEEGPFSFRAPWGEAMVVKPGDTIVQTPDNPKDTYRIARASFACTYDIVRAP